ncbi:MAG: hypothetical protein F6J95_000660 [Leptolyngbya sp. SIO1E4]|nr:hypothetical protein [Leptolyngbya sp. SIO1E4]
MRTTVSIRKPTIQASRPLRYLCAAALLIVAMTIAKGAIAWISERFIYTLPIMGGLLKSLELMEVSNVVVFATLGVGLGAFTRWLPRKKSLFQKAIALIISVPIVFLSSYVVRHYVWVQQVAIESELLPSQAAQVTDSLLVQATGQKGVWGFFKYTVQVPILPTDLSALQTVDEDDKWFRSELTRFSGLEPGIFTLLFRLTGWGIRLFYILLALVTAAIYFAKGLVWADSHRQPRR